MPKIFSVASWNVENLNSDAARVKRIAEFIKGQHGGPQNVPDIFALYEIRGKDIYFEFMKQFPDHRFHLTEGKQSQEIFIAVHKKFQTFSTQRLEFKVKREYQRPGLLLSLSRNNSHYSLLFLHIKSGANPEDFGLRDAAMISAFNLKKALDNSIGGQSNFIFLGDLNTMGINDPVPYSKQLDFSPLEEVVRLKDWAGKRDMEVLSKDKTLVDGVSEEVTWYNGSSSYIPTNLDHVVISEHMKIKDENGSLDNVTILGWPKLQKNAWNNWFNDYSDHALLYFEVWE
jgi:Endonuclease/Exonuclease/phosphatase family